jgi:hypothetical protein
MLCDSGTNRWLASKYIEGMDAIQMYSLQHAVVMKSLKMEVTSAKVIIFSWRVFFMILQLDYVHKLHTFVMGSIRRKRNILPQAFWGKSEGGEESYFHKSPIY